MRPDSEASTVSNNTRMDCDMSFSEHQCVTLACDECGEPFGQDDSPLHFSSRMSAIDYAVQMDWTVGPDRVRCDDCSPSA